MPNTTLANIHEITFAIFCLEDIPDSNITYTNINKGIFKGLAKDPRVNLLIKELHKECLKLKPNEHQEAKVKFIQSRKSVSDIKKYLGNTKKNPEIPIIWKKDAFDWTNKLTIKDCGWTNTPGRFNSFVGPHLTKCPAAGGSHDNNPSDVVLLLDDNKGNQTVMGISLKATFGKADIGIYNGGMCAFMRIICEKKDLADKKTLCDKTESDENTIKIPYDLFLNKCDTILRWSGNIANKKLAWKSAIKNDILLKKSLEKSKLLALSAMRDNLFNFFMTKNSLTLDKSDPNVCNGTISEGNANKIIGGIYQFTHAAIISGGCDVPYLKSTSFLSSKLSVSTGPSNCLTKVNAPLLTHYVDKGPNQLKLQKAGAVSFVLIMNDKPSFLIRVKLESVPPSGIKIDISPTKQKKTKITRQSPAAEPLSESPKTLTKSLINGMKVKELESEIKNRGLSKNGKKAKADLQQILINHLGLKGGNGNDIIDYTLDTTDYIFDSIVELIDHNINELSILSRLYSENFCNIEDDQDDDHEPFCDTINLTKKQMVRILIVSIENEIDSLTNEDADISKRMKISNPIMTRALQTLLNNIKSLNTLREKLIPVYNGSKRNKTKKNKKIKRKQSKRKKKNNKQDKY
tara:strand:- start:3664 stop:5556 length:1893 start_codon:yes stop_codon:yes gene_type:complete